MRFLSFLMGVLLAAPATAQGVDFTMTPRPDIPWASVPVLRSVAPDTPTILDIVPNGSPAAHGTLGVAGIHICDSDDFDGPFNCVALFAADEAVRIGSSNYGGEPPRRIEWLIGNRIVGYLDEKTFRLGDFDSQKAVRVINRQAREIRQLKREMRQMRAMLRKLARQR